jgi:hypothetical protein
MVQMLILYRPACAEDLEPMSLSFRPSMISLNVMDLTQWPPRLRPISGCLRSGCTSLISIFPKSHASARDVNAHRLNQLNVIFSAE